jgi:hypothetical protein
MTCGLLSRSVSPATIRASRERNGEPCAADPEGHRPRRRRRWGAAPRARNMIPEFTESDSQVPRTQAQLRAYVDCRRGQFGRTREGQHTARLSKGNLVKAFKEEVWILALFADAFYAGRPDVLFKPAIGNECYDALLLDASSQRVLHHLQITQAFVDTKSNASRGHGYQSHLRMCHLEKYGHAPLTGPMLQKNKITGEVSEVWPEAVAKSLENTFHGIQCAVERKASTRPEADAFLLVGFEDMSISSESDRAALDRFARAALVPTASNFAALYLVSGWRRLAFHYRVRGCDRICCRNLQ